MNDVEQDREHLTYWLKGNPHAVRFCEQFFYVCHLWDDLVDGDVPRETQHISDAFWMALVEIPANPFYVAHFNQLHPVIASVVSDWFTANKLEDMKKYEISYSLRCSILSLIQHCALLIGGPTWVQKVGSQIRLYGQQETLQEYKEGFKCQT